jgi:hypothetical protein
MESGAWAVESVVRETGVGRVAMGRLRGAGVAIIRGPGSGDAMDRERGRAAAVGRSAGVAALVLVLSRVALWASFSSLAARHARRTRTGAFSNTVSPA